jgi:hypothetical protein
MNLRLGSAATIALLTVLAKPGVVHGQAPPSAALSSARIARVRVYLAGSKNAQLEQDATGNEDWRTVCSAPCDVDVAVGSHYRINGSSLRASEEFILHGRDGDHVTIAVDGASTAWFVVGILLIPAGGLVAACGVVVDLMSLIAGTNEGRQLLLAAGSTAIAIGLAGLVAGAVLVNSNSATTVSSPSTEAAQLAGSSHSWRFSPVGREPSPTDRAMPPLVAAPLWSMHF